MQVIVMTSAKYHRLLPGFCYLFNEFWGVPAIIATDEPVPYELPPNFDIRTYSDWKPQGADRWSNALRYTLDHVSDGLVTLMLEDYYLVRPVDTEAIKLVIEFFHQFPHTLLRFDLTTDREFNGHAKDMGSYGKLKLVETPWDSEYQMSFQAGMWNRLLLRSIVRKGLTPWETEIQTKPPEQMRVFGSKNEPVKYTNVANSGGGRPRVTYSGIPEEHLRVMREHNLLMEEKR